MVRKRNKNIKGTRQRIKYRFLKILTGSDLSSRKLPLIKFNSIHPGPVIWLLGCMHGDEVGGLVVIQEIFNRLKKYPLKKGAVYAFPLMNPVGFETKARNIGLSEEDLNRVFPGDKKGSLAERIAEQIYGEITDTNPNLVLDIHNDWRNSIPYTVIDYNAKEDNELYSKVKDLARTSGFAIIEEQSTAPDSEELKKTLTYNLVKNKIPALTLEIGEPHVINEKNVEEGVKSIWKILVSLNMVNDIKDEFRFRIPKEVKGKILKYSHALVSSKSGIIRFLIKPGEIIKKNQPLALIYNSFGELQETILSEKSGIILGYSDSSVAFPGMPIVSFGEI